MLRMGALMTLLLVPSFFIGQPLYKWKSGKAMMGNAGMLVNDTVEYKGHLFHVWYTFDFYPKQLGESNTIYLYYFTGKSFHKWEDFKWDEYGREYVKVSAIIKCLNGNFDNVKDSLYNKRTLHWGAFPEDSFPLNDGKGKYKKTFRLSRSLPNTGRPVYVTSEVEIDLKRMKGNKVKTTFSTKEGNAEYDILYHYYYRGPKKQNIINFPPPLE